MHDGHDDDTPSRWVTRFATMVNAGGTVLDLACGGGRHARFFAARGHPVLAVDRAPDVAAEPRLQVLTADLEAEALPAELSGQRFDCIVVTGYLHRPLLPWIVHAVAPGGWLLYETFAVGNERYGHPRNLKFLLRPGELFGAVRGTLAIVAYEHGLVETPGGKAVIQRIAATRTHDVPLLSSGS